MSSDLDIVKFIEQHAHHVYYVLGVASMCYTFFRFLKAYFEKTKLHEMLKLISEVPLAIEEIREHQKKMYSQIKLHNNVVTTILDTLELAQFLCDENGMCINVNRHWVNLTGLSEKEAEGNNWIISVHQDDRERIRVRWNALIDTSSPFDEIFRYQHCINNTVTKVRCTAKEIKNEKQERIFVIGLSKIIS